MTSAAWTALFNQHAITDSALIYLASTMDDATTRTTQFHLVVVNNDQSGSRGGSYTLKVIFPAGTVMSQTTQTYGPGAQVSVSGTTITATFSWALTEKNGLIIKGMPSTASDVTIQVLSASGVEQVLLAGASQTAIGALEVMKVDPRQWNAIYIGGSQCTNPCAGITSCSACAADSRCGWCIETDSCLPGTASGPSISACKNWRYTFDSDVNRRLTQTLAYPVNPGNTEVYLTTTASVNNIELPIEAGVVVGNPKTIEWDLAYLSEYTGDAKKQWSRQVQEVLTLLSNYPNIGAAWLSLQNNADGYSLQKILSNPRDTYWIPDALNSAALSPAGPLPVMKALYQAGAASPNTPGWRTGTRKIILVNAISGFTTGDKVGATTITVQVLRDQLMKQNIIPVFAVPEASVTVRAQYAQLVRDLGFGIMVNLNQAFDNLAFVTRRAITKAAGHAAVIVDPQAQGHVDPTLFSGRSESFTMFGLGNMYRAKFWVPVKRQVTDARSKLNFPGFGSATIETVPTDRPVAKASPTKFTVKENVDTTFPDVVVELPGESFKNLYKVVPRITVLPAGTGTAELYQAATTKDASTGKISVVAGNQITAIDGTNNVVSDKLSRVVVRPLTAGTITFSYVSTDGCSDSLPVVITVVAQPGNHAPIASMMAPLATEDVPLVITLGGDDQDSTPFDAYIVQATWEGIKGNTNAPGKIYQYAAGFDPAATFVPANFVLINDGDKVTDASHRIIYVPPPYANSYSDPAVNAELLVIPCFSYKLVESTGATPLTSNTLEVQVLIQPVNNAPFVWGDQSAADWMLPWAQSDNLCWQDGAACTFLEDFGQEFPWNVGYEFLYMGGDDVEKSKLDFEITSLDCYPGIDLTVPLVMSDKVKVGDTIRKQEPGQLLPLLRFRPVPDTNNDSWQKNYYCKIGYVAVDQEGARSTENTITISITPVDKPPRLGSADTTVVAKEQTPKLFTLDAIDPENNNFDAYLLSCDVARGTYEVCRDDDCTVENRQQLDCANIPADGLKLERFVGVPSATGPYTLVFTSDAIESLAEGANYNQWVMQFRDGSQQDNSNYHSFFVNFRVISVNSPPVITVDGEVKEKHIMAQAVGKPWSAKLEATDSDLANGNMLISMTLKGVVNHEGIELIVQGLSGLESLIEKKSKYELVFKGRQEDVTAILSKITIAAGNNPKLQSQAVLTIVANDLGNSGQCPTDDDVKVSVCELTTKTEIEITWAKAEDNSMVTIAASASAAGFAGVAAIAAVALFRKFNQQAETDAYQPWDSTGNDEGVVNNPLYEQSGAQGSNALYEARK